MPAPAAHLAHPDHPWLAAVADLLARWPAGALPPLAELQAGLRDHLAPHGLALVAPLAAPRRRKRRPAGTDASAAPDLDPRTIYELRIADTGEIPTRPDNLHDLCNALSWAAFPRAKWALTRRIAELQRARLDATGRLPAARDREHDRLALLDEGGLLSLTGSEGTRAVLVGHALWQHAALGHREVRAAAVHLPQPAPPWSRASCAEVRAAVDAAWLALVTSPETLAAAMGERAGVFVDDAALWRAPPAS